MRESAYTRICDECSKPSTGFRCQKCFRKGKKRTLSRLYSSRRLRKKRQEKIKNDN